MSSSTFYRNDPIEQTEKKPLFIPPKRKKVIVIAGPTATGKTELSLIIAKAVGGEIISSDSMQLYRHTDIGTAKPTKEELRAVPHHLIDIRDIRETCNVVDFYEEARRALKEIHLKDKVAIVVGGAGFYMHSFLYGPPKGPPSHPNLRAKLEEDMEKFGPEMLYTKLKECDPDYAASITVHDRHKVIRALEIIIISGKRVSEIPRPTQEDLSKEYDFRCWFIYYPKPLLYKRIEERCDKMIEMGLVDEVVRLCDEGLEENPSVARSIGYRQCLAYLNSAQTDSDWEEFLTSFKKASRHYAKRQFTWFRKEPLFRWLDLSQCSLATAAEIIIQDYEQR